MSPEVDDSRQRRLGQMVRAILFGMLVVVGVVYVGEASIWKGQYVLSPLGIYGFLVILLALVGTVSNRLGKPAVAISLLYLLFIDIALAETTSKLSRTFNIPSLKPTFRYSMVDLPKFSFHPLLQIVPTAGYQDGRFAHTSRGTRAVLQESAVAEGLPQIAVVGGSSTYDVALEQGNTWADQVQRHLRGYRVWNYGAPGYSTAEHLIQSAMYFPESSIKCAVYYIGWNDIRNALLPDLDPGYANFHLLTQGNLLRKNFEPGFTALVKLTALLVSYADIYPHVPARFANLPLRKGVDKRLEDIYRRNINAIIALNKQNGVRTAFIGQLLNYSKLRSAPPGTRSGWLPAVADNDVPALQDRFNDILREEADRARVPVLLPAQHWLDKADFADQGNDPGHFAASGAKKFAAHAAPFIRQACES